MRALWFVPITFIAGQHGFDLFAPYLVAFLAITHFARGWRKRPIPADLVVSTTSPQFAV